MSSTLTEAFPRFLRQLATSRQADPRCDTDLLTAFASRRDGDAFGALVTRHGPLVWGTCLRLLGDSDQAEDAFQATFLVLAKKAAAVAGCDTLAGWLYVAARRTVQEMRRAGRRRREHERRASTMRQRRVTPAVTTDSDAVLDEELARLPATYRTPLVLCYLQGKTHAEAARELGCAISSVSRRLTRGCELLRGRLAHRGVVLATGSAAAALSRASASAAMPLHLARSTTAAALEFAGGAAVGTTAAKVAQGVIQSMSGAKLKLCGLLLAALAGAGLGAGLARPGPASAADEAAAPASPPPAGPAAGGKARTDRFGDPLPDGALARIGTVRFRQTANHIAFLADGKSFVAGDGSPFGETTPGDSIRVWDLASGKEVRQLEGYPGGVAFLGFSPESQLVAFRGGKKDSDVVRLWDPATGLEMPAPARLRVGDGIFAACPGGKIVVLTARGGGKFCLKEADTGAVRAKGELDNKAAVVTAVAWSPDGKNVALGCDEGDKQKEALVRVWDPAAGRVRRKLRGPKGLVGKLIYSRDGSTLAALYTDDTARVWDAATGAERLSSDGGVGPFALSPDGRWLLTSSRDGKTALVLRDLTAGKEVWRKPWSSGLMARDAAAFTPDGKTVVVRVGSVLRRWEVATGKELVIAPVLSTTAVAPGGETLASMADDNVVHLWDVASGKLLHALQGDSGRLLALAFSPNGGALASGGMDGTVRLWDVATGRQRGLLKGTRPVIGVKFSHDGRRLFVSDCREEGLDDGNFEGAVHVWDLAAGGPPRRLIPPRACPKNMPEISPDGKFLVDSGFLSGEVDLWGAAGGGKQERQLWTGEDSIRVAFAPDGRSLATAQQRIQVWDPATGQCLRTLADLSNLMNHSWFDQLVFSPDGRRLAAADVRGLLGLWDPAAGKQLWRCQPLDAARRDTHVSSIAFAADGRTLVTAAADGRVHVWDAATGQEVCRLDGHQGQPVQSVAFTGNGRRLVSCGDDGSAVVWELRHHLPAVLYRDASLTPRQAQVEWEGLAAPAHVAYRAVAALAADPPRSVPLLRERLLAVPPGADRLAALIADLDSGDFKVRQQAEAELGRLGDAAVEALQAARDGSPSAEVRRRAAALLKRPAATGGALRRSRAVAVLEFIDSRESRQLLEALAAGNPGGRLTQEAKAALGRLSPRGH
jgi:RNA polymerase sigma factor (sigma-70 family)